ncbi:MAG: glutaredoxin family protein [Nitrososphaeria archaeon]|jgi:glutaredoxin
MEAIKVQGKNLKHKVLMYTLSTCAWCKRTKKFLSDNDIGYEYIDMDLCKEEDREKIRKDIRDRGGAVAFPTMIVDNKILITGFVADKIKEALEI